MHETRRGNLLSNRLSPDGALPWGTAEGGRGLSPRHRGHLLHLLATSFIRVIAHHKDWPRPPRAGRSKSRGPPRPNPLQAPRFVSISRPEGGTRSPHQGLEEKGAHPGLNSRLVSPFPGDPSSPRVSSRSRRCGFCALGRCRPPHPCRTDAVWRRRWRFTARQAQRAQRATAASTQHNISQQPRRRAGTTTELFSLPQFSTPDNKNIFLPTPFHAPDRTPVACPSQQRIPASPRLPDPPPNVVFLDTR